MKHTAQTLKYYLGMEVWFECKKWFIACISISETFTLVDRLILPLDGRYEICIENVYPILKTAESMTDEDMTSICGEIKG